MVPELVYQISMSCNLVDIIISARPGTIYLYIVSWNVRYVGRYTHGPKTTTCVQDNRIVFNPIVVDDDGAAWLLGSVWEICNLRCPVSLNMCRCRSESIRRDLPGARNNTEFVF